MNKIKAFTLTESLIMIAIVGVIATITMVSLAGLKPNKDKMLLQKAYKTTMSVVAELTNDPVAYPPLKSAYNFKIEKQMFLAVINDPNGPNLTTKFTDQLSTKITNDNPEITGGILLPTGGSKTTNIGDIGTGSGSSSNNGSTIVNDGITIDTDKSHSNSGFVLPDIGTSSTGPASTGNSASNVTITKASAALTDRSIPARDSGKYTSTNKFAYLFANKLIVNQSSARSSLSCSGAACTFRTNDGMSWTVTDGFKANNANSTSTVVVDINGSRGPNKSYNASNPNEVKTPDRFTFTIRANGQVVVPSTDAVALKYLSTRGNK